MLGLFAAVAVALHNGFRSLSVEYVYALIALASSYVSATSLNDLADEAIDKINHAGKPGRLLVTGEASRHDLAAVGAIAAGLMLMCGWLISPVALALMAASLVINIAYSLPPLRLSYRTFLVPLVLAIGYVVIPYGLGLVLVGAKPGIPDAFLLAGLYALFLARINLKDFRDRAGDATFGKPTLLLRFGKNTTIAASDVALWLGIALVVAPLIVRQPFVLITAAYGVVISWLLTRLAAAPVGAAEQVIIGVAAKIGNGLLLSVLAIFLLVNRNAPGWIVAFALALLFGASLANLNYLKRDPHELLGAYRG
jgi:4-hydroxybenzoate polyprenyltransferase